MDKRGAIDESLKLLVAIIIILVFFGIVGFILVTKFKGMGII